jgi:serine/threonine protein kinase
MASPAACPGSERLRQLFDGNLPAVDQIALAEHLETCASCQRTLEGLAAGSETWSSMARQRDHDEGNPGVDDPTLQRVMEQARAEGMADGTRTVFAPGEALPADFLSSPTTSGHIGRLGHYEVIEVIGCGGMGVVLKAIDEALHRVVAIKVMASHLAANGTARRRFIREAQAAAAVTNDHVITIYSVEEAHGIPYLVMSLIAGESLQKRLDRLGPPELREILRIGMQIAHGLAAAHAQGLVHRDIKPSNILLENAVQRVKITDFGLARAVDDPSLTASGTVAGTPLYMAPEQARGDRVDHRTDLFSLGSVLYALCTGRPPFRGPSTVAVLKRVCEDTPRPIRELNPEIPKELVAIIDRLHAKDPAGRFQSAAEVSELLCQQLARLQQPSLVPEAISPEQTPPFVPHEARRRRKKWVKLAALGLLSVVMAMSVAAGIRHLMGGRGRSTASGPDESGQVVGSKPGRTDSEAIATTARPFAVLARDDRPERAFAKLSGAVAFASSGDTIEIRGEGPFAVNPIQIGDRALTIRSARGVRPVIILNPQLAPKDSGFMLQTSAPLVLEGLELQLGRESRQNDGSGIIILNNSSIRAANCRFLLQELHRLMLVAQNAPSVELCNCELLTVSEAGLVWVLPLEGRFDLANCVLLARYGGLNFNFGSADVRRLDIRLERNTFVANVPIAFVVHIIPQLSDDGARRLITLTASDNILYGQSTISQLHQSAILLKSREALPISEISALLPRMVKWKGRANLYQKKDGFLGTYRQGLPDDYAIQSLADWTRFWGNAETDSISGRVRFRGGDLLARLVDDPSTFTLEDYRLLPNSPGHHGGEGGRDLGADIDLVGPGLAYERWKTTTEYQEWSRTSAQMVEGWK